MKGWLYFTPESMTGTARFDSVWCGAEGVALRECTLAEAAQVFQGHAIQIILPMETCSWLRTPPWPTRRAPRTQALLYSVEEQLSEDVEGVHVAVGLRDTEHRYPLLIVSRSLLREVLSVLDEAGIQVGSVQIDADMLPDDQPHLVWWAGRWMLGGKVGCRLAFSDEARTFFASRLPEGLCVRDVQPDAAETAAFLAAGRKMSIDLLQGEFRVAPRRWRWSLPLLTLACLGLMSWGFSVARIQHLESEALRLHEQSLQRFQTLYPDQGRVGDLSTRFSALQARQAVGREPMATFSMLIERVLGSAEVEVRHVGFTRAQGWKVAIAVKDFTALERLRDQVERSGLPIRIDGASKHQDGVKAMLIIGVDEA